MAQTRYLELLDDLVVEGKESFTTRDVEELSELSPQAASNLLTRLVDHGLVDRVARGHYVLRPFGTVGTRAATEDIGLAVGAVFANRPHRIAYRSALDWHDLLAHPTKTIFIAVVTRPSLLELSGRPVKFVAETSDRIRVGAIDADHGARVSSIERALLESAARPELAGGIQSVANALSRADVDPVELSSLARRLGLRSALHRLGSLAATFAIEPLADRLEPLSSVGRPIQLEEIDQADKHDAWRDDKWGVVWPYAAEELEEALKN
jgi:predicted transcriptional regulator of viral defense system